MTIEEARFKAARAEYELALKRPPHADPLVPAMWVVVCLGLGAGFGLVGLCVRWVIRVVGR